MARGRFINKAISLDEKVDALSDDTARLLFTWLIAHLDCEGRMHGDAVTVKSIVFPRRNISQRKIEKYLKELEKFELIFRYSVNGNQYLWMKNFEKHQVGLKKNREAQSQIPPFTQELIRTNVGESPSEVKVKVKVKVKTPKGGQRKALPSTKKAEKDPRVTEIFTEMRSYLGFPDKVKIDPIPSYGKEGQAIKRMFTRGFTREEILACWKGKVSQRGGEFVSMTWVNQDIGTTGTGKQKQGSREPSTAAEIAESIRGLA
jgi:hypothetical protein